MFLMIDEELAKVFPTPIFHIYYPAFWEKMISIPFAVSVFCHSDWSNRNQPSVVILQPVTSNMLCVVNKFQQ